MSAPNPAPVPPPGSDAAIRAGCTCPVLDNAHGAGIGGGLWWIDSECPLHGADGYWQLDAELSDMHMRPRAGGEARMLSSAAPRLLDLFCCAGGAATGYHRAGFDVVGVDIKPQPNYPFQFVQADALEYVAAHGREFDAIHASPPCQFGTGVQNLGRARNGSYPEHINMIPQTRAALIKTGKPYDIENVAGARKHLINPVMLCGAYFGLKVYRHRYFECSFSVPRPIHAPHNDSTPSAGNGKSPKGFISVCGTGGVRGMKSKEIIEYWQMAMGIDWINTRHELAEAIPPAYTEYIGRFLMAAVLEKQTIGLNNVD